MLKRCGNREAVRSLRRQRSEMAGGSRWPRPTAAHPTDETPKVQRPLWSGIGLWLLDNRPRGPVFSPEFAPNAFWVWLLAPRLWAPGAKSRAPDAVTATACVAAASRRCRQHQLQLPALPRCRQRAQAACGSLLQDHAFGEERSRPRGAVSLAPGPLKRLLHPPNKRALQWEALSGSCAARSFGKKHRANPVDGSPAPSCCCGTQAPPPPPPPPPPPRGSCLSPAALLQPAPCQACPTNWAARCPVDIAGQTGGCQTGGASSCCAGGSAAWARSAAPVLLGE